MKEQLEVLSCKCIKPVWDALKRCGSFKRLSFSQCSRIKEGISAEPPRNSACTGTRYAVRSENWRLTSARHESQGGVDHRDRRSQRRRAATGDVVTSQLSESVAPALQNEFFERSKNKCGIPRRLAGSLRPDTTTLHAIAKQRIQ